MNRIQHGPERGRVRVVAGDVASASASARPSRPKEPSAGCCRRTVMTFRIRLLQAQEWTPQYFPDALVTGLTPTIEAMASE